MDLNSSILVARISTISLRKIESATGISKNRVWNLRKNPHMATLADLIKFAKAGYIDLSIR